MDKIAWEGGSESAVEYGLTAADADDPKLGELWDAIATQYGGGRSGGRSLEELTDELQAYAALTTPEFD